MKLLNVISLIIGSMGLSVIVWGVAVSFYEFFYLEKERLKKRNVCIKKEYLRHHLGSYLLIGLEFLVAADIVHSIIRPTLEDLARLGAIVTIRTLLSYFLNKEMRDAHNCSINDTYGL